MRTDLPLSWQLFPTSNRSNTQPIEGTNTSWQASNGIQSVKRSVWHFQVLWTKVTCQDSRATRLWTTFVTSGFTLSLTGLLLIDCSEWNRFGSRWLCDSITCMEGRMMWSRCRSFWAENVAEGKRPCAASIRCVNRAYFVVFSLNDLNERIQQIQKTKTNQDTSTNKQHNWTDAETGCLLLLANGCDSVVEPSR